MFWKLLILFCTIPFVELALLLWLGQHMGWLATLGLVLVTGTLGAILAKQQGWRCVTRIQEELRAGEMPSTSLVDGLLIIIAATLLLTPGLITDTFGFTLLVPQSRAWVRRRLSNYFRHRIQWNVVTPGGRSQPSHDEREEYVVDVTSQPVGNQRD